MHVHLSRWPTLLLLLSLAGCSTLQPGDVAVGGEHWQLSGKLGIWSGDQRDSAQIDWLNCGAHYRIRLSGPLGGSAAILSSDGHRVTLERRGEDSLSAATAEELAATLGWPLPVSALRHWVLARPVPQQPFQAVTNSDGHLSNMQQLGWQLRFDRYRSRDSSAIPQLLELNGAALRVKLLVRQWQAAPTGCAELLAGDAR